MDLESSSDSNRVDIDYQTSGPDIFRYILALEDENDQVDPLTMAGKMPYESESLEKDLEKLEEAGYITKGQRNENSFIGVENADGFSEYLEGTAYSLPEDDELLLFEEMEWVELTEQGREYAEEELEMKYLKDSLDYVFDS